MNVLYSSDENYAKLSMISIASLLENNQDIENICIYYIDAGLSEETKHKLAGIINKFKRTIHFLSSNSIDVSFIAKTGYSIAGYYRLLISNLIDVDKILYLDCDTIVLNSLDALWNIDISDVPLAGVRDTVQNYLATSIGMVDNSDYVNAGIMLLNLDYWRTYDCEQSIKSFFDSCNGKVPHHDQGIINGVFQGKIKIIDPIYNVMSQYFLFSKKQLVSLYKINNFYSDSVIEQSIKNPVIIHFLNKFYGRPWELNCEHPYTYKFDEINNKYGIGLVKKGSSLTNRIKVRKFLYNHTPFYIYLFYERIMDIKRKRVFFLNYKKKKV